MVLVTIRGRLREDPGSIRQIHDGVTAATKEMALQAGDISQPDRAYIAQLAATRGGITQEEAEMRVSALIEQAKAAGNKAKAAADTARKSAASSR